MSDVSLIRVNISRMEEHRLPYRAYEMLFALDVWGKKTWVSGIRKTLYKYGFGYAWLNQGSENINVFLKNFRRRLIDCGWQDLDDHIQSSDKFYLNRTFRSSSNSEMYLLLDINRHIKCIMTRFRWQNWEYHVQNSDRSLVYTGHVIVFRI